MIPTICTDEIGGLIRDGIISGGMLPKITAPKITHSPPSHCFWRSIEFSPFTQVK